MNWLFMFKRDTKLIHLQYNVLFTLRVCTDLMISKKTGSSMYPKTLMELRKARSSSGYSKDF